MIARHIEINLKPEKLTEFKTIMEKEVNSILQRQPGFLGSLELKKENRPEHTVTVTLWHSKTDVENYNKKEYPKILEMVKPFIKETPKVEYFNVEHTTMKLEHTVAA
jgi:heme-degrading monooxygenase HmoA